MDIPGMNLSAAMEDIAIIPHHDYLVAVCTNCVPQEPDGEIESELLTDNNAGKCGCRSLKCLTDWAIQHIIEMHAIPRIVTATMENNERDRH